MAPHHVTGGAGADHGIGPGFLDRLYVLTHGLFEGIPFACDQHGRRAAVFFFAQECKINAGLVEQSHCGHADIMLDIACRTARKIDRPGFDSRPVFREQILREPVHTVLPVSGPYIAFRL